MEDINWHIHIVLDQKIEMPMFKNIKYSLNETHHKHDALMQCNLSKTQTAFTLAPVVCAVTGIKTKNSRLLSIS
ncbi:hypothetical protein HYN46_11710 [Aquirhabdus parva]|uniref:Uncharacterized protein n=1 Tax=Aquirhabdus parva TaxID=2283318 RepID=A0A345P837_9GAMM|nr:hypothetical protein HYN46_11710 [Aquirhabdus parva]